MSKEIQIYVSGLGTITALWGLGIDYFHDMMRTAIKTNAYVRLEIRGSGIMYINPAHIIHYKVIA